MGSLELSSRSSCWVAEAAQTGSLGEATVLDILQKGLGDSFKVHHEPPKLQVYPSGRGIRPAFRITNTANQRSVFVEHKAGNNGGNAHERVYKYLSPEIQRVVKKDYNTPKKPFIFVFTGDTFQNERYQEELETTLKKEKYVVLKTDNNNALDLVNTIKNTLS